MTTTTVKAAAVLSLMLLSLIEMTPQRPATLTGCASDIMGQPIPGATILARAQGIERTTVAGANGCYTFADLPRGSYRVTARLLGFDNVTQDRVVLAPGKYAHAHFTLYISRVCECVSLPPPQSLAEAWQRADAVIYVRLSDADATTPAPEHYYRHVGTVLEVLKPHPVWGPANRTAAVLEHQENGAPAPFAAGQEVVVFPKWVGQLSAFVGLGTDCCRNPETVFVIQDGRIREASAGLSRYVGMPIDTFLRELRSSGAVTVDRKD